MLQKSIYTGTDVKREGRGKEEEEGRGGRKKKGKYRITKGIERVDRVLIYKQVFLACPFSD